MEIYARCGVHRYFGSPVASSDSSADVSDATFLAGPDLLPTASRRFGRQTFPNLEIPDDEGERRD